MKDHSRRVETTYRLRPGTLAWRRVGDEVVALDLRRSTYLAANRTAAALWPALTEGATRHQLLAVALARFHVDPVRAVNDIDSLLTALAELDLLDEIAQS